MYTLYLVTDRVINEGAERRILLVPTIKERPKMVETTVRPEGCRGLKPVAESTNAVFPVVEVRLSPLTSRCGIT